MRDDFRTRITTADPDDLVVLNEMGSSISLTRAPKEQRARGSISRNHGTNPTLIGALTDATAYMRFHACSVRHSVLVRP